ncbi:p26 [Bean yellow disorder virus]|uniref:p26 n=1 Tax=Bean yellow disorder virus TaxID=267970 RepID=B2BZW2_9CLOS|nr:p26 [Bean yellow disorder virus]ABY66961.1 p26 [Bean yellow disorder virus]
MSFTAMMNELNVSNKCRFCRQCSLYGLNEIQFSRAALRMLARVKSRFESTIVGVKYINVCCIITCMKNFRSTYPNYIVDFDLLLTGHEILKDKDNSQPILELLFLKRYKLSDIMEDLRNLLIFVEGYNTSLFFGQIYVFSPKVDFVCFDADNDTVMFKLKDNWFIKHFSGFEDYYNLMIGRDCFLSEGLLRLEEGSVKSKYFDFIANIFESNCRNCISE